MQWEQTLFSVPSCTIASYTANILGSSHFYCLLFSVWVHLAHSHRHPQQGTSFLALSRSFSRVRSLIKFVCVCVCKCLGAIRPKPKPTSEPDRRQQTTQQPQKTKLKQPKRTRNHRNPPHRVLISIIQDDVGIFVPLINVHQSFANDQSDRLLFY